MTPQPIKGGLGGVIQVRGGGDWREGLELVGSAGQSCLSTRKRQPAGVAETCGRNVQVSVRPPGTEIYVCVCVRVCVCA